jgi:DNA-binding transcriptional LysR family regulator
MRSAALRDYRLIAIFAAIADAGSIRAAARRLGLSAPVISTALTALEANLGTTLMRRGGRRMEPTATGAAFHIAASEMVLAAERAMETVKAEHRRPSGRLSITMPTELCQAWLPPVLRAFEARYPLVETRVHASDDVDDLSEGNFDIALRARRALEAPRAALTTLPLALVARADIANAYPTLAAARRTPVPMIAFTPLGRVASLDALDAAGARIEVPCAPRIAANNGLLAAALAREGFGAALVAEAGVEADIEAGRLARVLPSLDFGHIAVRLAFRDAHPSPAALAFARLARGEINPPPRRR